jgi:hypothetical protein
MTLSSGTADPRLSIVVAARNDNYGGDFLHRMQIFISSLLQLLREHECHAELLVVEWNPPPAASPLVEALKWPREASDIVRIVQVSHAIHEGLPNADRIGMFEYLAKNVGIRRARGRFVLVTNPDLIFSVELVRALAEESISETAFYRADRYDFRGTIPEGSDVRAALDFAQKRVFQVHIRHDLRQRMVVPIRRPRRWLYTLSGGWPGTIPAYRRRREPGWACVLDDNTGIYGGIHTNASGDFILTTRGAWEAVRGFPERFDSFTHLDSYACHQLKALGLRQCLVLPPCMIFHAEHLRHEQATRPRRPQAGWEDELDGIRCGRLGPALNAPDWGMADLELPEYAPTARSERCAW